MVFEPYSEVVLPPDKGTGISRRKRKPAEKQSLSAPKEYKRSADSIAIDNVEPDELLAQGARDKILPATEQQVDVREQPIIIHPLLDEDDASPDSEGKGRSPSAESEVPATPAGSSVDAAEVDAAELDQSVVENDGKNDSPTSAAPSARKSKAASPSTDGPKDFLVAYDGRFIGHFRSEKRISNRKVFEKAARRLQEGFDEFDIGLLEIYKPVKLKVDTPEDMSKIAEGAFQWF